MAGQRQITGVPGSSGFQPPGSSSKGTALMSSPKQRVLPSSAVGRTDRHGTADCRRQHIVQVPEAPQMPHLLTSRSATARLNRTATLSSRRTLGPRYARSVRLASSKPREQYMLPSGTPTPGRPTQVGQPAHRPSLPAYILALPGTLAGFQDYPPSSFHGRSAREADLGA